MEQVFSTHNLKSVKEFNDFLYDIRYILVFYVLGDFITTAKALNYGVEANGFMALVMAEFGVWALFPQVLVVRYSLLMVSGCLMSSRRSMLIDLKDRGMILVINWGM